LPNVTAPGLVVKMIGDHVAPPAIAQRLGLGGGKP
jgi:hypothetical protein